MTNGPGSNPRAVAVFSEISTGRTWSADRIHLIAVTTVQVRSTASGIFGITVPGKTAA